MGIDADILKDNSKHVPSHAMEQLLSLLIEASGDPCFGLHSAQFVEPASYSVLGYISMNCSTLRMIQPTEKTAPPPVACLPFQPLPFPISSEGGSPKGCGNDANGPENYSDLVSLWRLRTKNLHLKEVQNCIWSIPRGSKSNDQSYSSSSLSSGKSIGISYFL